jgi:flagellin-like protein
LTRKMIRPRKAISPILATLLLVVIAVAAIVVTYAWVMTYMNNANRQAGVVLYLGNIDFYDHNTSTPKIAIDVGNSGTQGTTIIALYIGTSDANMQQQTFTPAQAPVSSGNLTTITVNYNWTISTIYYFKVVGQPGAPLGPVASQSPVS